MGVLWPVQAQDGHRPTEGRGWLETSREELSKGRPELRSREWVAGRGPGKTKPWKCLVWGVEGKRGREWGRGGRLVPSTCKGLELQ